MLAHLACPFAALATLWLPPAEAWVSLQNDEIRGAPSSCPCGQTRSDAILGQPVAG